MSGRGGYAPGSRSYERNKDFKKRKGPRRGPPPGSDAAPAEDPDAWRRKKKDDDDEDDEEEDEDASGPEEEDNAPAKGNEEKAKPKPEPLIDVDNPNRQKKTTVKASTLDANAKPELSRREREAAEKQQAKERYWEMHKAGKTDEAKADLARLAVIRKQREEAAKQREEELQAKEAAKAAARKR